MQMAQTKASVASLALALYAFRLALKLRAQPECHDSGPDSTVVSSVGTPPRLTVAPQSELLQTSLGSALQRRSALEFDDTLLGGDDITALGSLV